MVTELWEMSKEYLRQETIEPAKQLGRQAGLGIGGGVLLAFGAILLVWGLYFGLLMVLPDGNWWGVLAKVITAATALIAAGLVVWRMQTPNPEESGA